MCIKTSQQFLLHVIAHNYSLQSLSALRERHLSNIIRCLWEYDRVRGYEINRVCFDNRDYLYRWEILERQPSHVYQQPTQQVTDIVLTVPSSLTSEMIRIGILDSFMHRQHVYDLDKQKADCLVKKLIMLGFMDLRGPRVCLQTTSFLLSFVEITSRCLDFTEKTLVFNKYVSCTCITP